MAKMRSPNYPALGLSEAVTLSTALWDKEKKTQVSSTAAAIAIGYKGLSGPSRTALAAMKKYGLLDEDKLGLRVSPLALRIIHPANENDRIQALREAAIKPELFRQLLLTHREASSDALRSYLITRLDFSEIGAKTLIDAFKDTIAVAKLDDPEYTLDHSTQDEEMTGTSVSIIPARDLRQSNTTQKTRIFSWPLSKDVSAELKLSGNEIKSSHLELLTKYLELAKEAMKTEEN